MGKVKSTGRRQYMERCRAAARRQLPKILAEQNNKCYYCRRFVVVIRSIPDYLRLEQKDPYQVYFRTLEGEVRHALIATIDHVVPLSKNGSNLRTNLVAACRRCNVRRGRAVQLAGKKKVKQAKK